MVARPGRSSECATSPAVEWFAQGHCFGEAGRVRRRTVFMFALHSAVSCLHQATTS